MAIIASQTVGEVVYVKISEPYPLFSSTTKYVAINSDGDIFTNIPNSSQWFSLKKNKYSEMQSWNNALTLNIAGEDYYQFLGTQISPTATALNGFTIGSLPNTSICLSANSETIGRFITTSIIGTTTPTGGNPDQIPSEVHTALNTPISGSTISGFLSWGFGSDCSSDDTFGAATQYCQRIINIDGNSGDYIRNYFGAFQDTTPSSFGSLVFQDYKLTTFLLDKPVILEYQNFESGTLGGWLVANENQNNKWVVGTGTSASGLYSAYITTGNTSSSPNVYNATATSVSHLYKDIKFPLGNASQDLYNHYISFRYKVSGTSRDYGKVFLCPTTIIPSGGSNIDEYYRLGVKTGMVPSYFTQNGDISLNGVLSGTSGYFGGKFVFSGLALPSTAITTTSLNETWESGTYSGVSGGWTVVNGAQINKWNVGSATTSGGVYSLYITNAVTGTSAVNSYSNSTSKSHIYRTISIPSSAVTATLTFNWRCNGENGGTATQYDYGSVTIIDTGTTPTAGTEVTPTTLATAGGNGRIGASTNDGKFNSGYTFGGLWNFESIDMTSYIGLTKRIVFSWKNDLSVGVNPPMAIDNIILTYTTRNFDSFTKDEDGYVTNRLVFTWENDNTTSVNPPLSVDDICVYSYVAVPNDKQ